jgi:hypothetical protein
MSTALTGTAFAGWNEDYIAAKRACEKKFNTVIIRVQITDTRIICTIEDSQSVYGAKGNYVSTGSTPDKMPRGMQ